MMTNPYIGLRSYEESDAAVFKGRSTATADLYELLVNNGFVVFHSESGEGKSSLINAGLCPLLREERYFPIRINLTEYDFNDSDPDFDDIVRWSIVDAICKANGTDQKDLSDLISDSSTNTSATIKITPLDQSNEVKDIQRQSKLYRNTWWLLRNYIFEAYGVRFTPVLIFDQFEEVFTRPGSITWTENFFLWLKALSTDNCPEYILKLIRQTIGEDAPFPRLLTGKQFKALFSLRNEYIGDLDYWGVQRHFIATLKNSRYCLKPLTLTETDEVLNLQHKFSDEIKDKIKESLSTIAGDRNKERYSDLPSVSALLLSVVCDTLSTNLTNAASQIQSFNINQAQGLTGIIGEFYDRIIKDCQIPRPVQHVIENVLVDPKGKRVRIKSDWESLASINFETEYMDRLIDCRLIKCSKINGDNYIELTHDVLAKVIDERRRLFLESKEQKRHTRASIICTIQCIAASLFGASFVFESNILSELSRWPNAIMAGLMAVIISIICYPRKSRWTTFGYIACSLLFTATLYFNIPFIRHVTYGAPFCLVLLASFLGSMYIRSGFILRYGSRVICGTACYGIISIIMPHFTGLALFIFAYLLLGPYGASYRKKTLILIIGYLSLLLAIKNMFYISTPWDMEILDQPFAVFICTMFLLWLIPIKLKIFKEKNISGALSYCASLQILKDEPLLMRTFCAFCLTLILSAALAIGHDLSILHSLIMAPILSIAAYLCIIRLYQPHLGRNDLNKHLALHPYMLGSIIVIISLGICLCQFLAYGAFIATALIAIGCYMIIKLMHRQNLRQWSVMISVCLCSMIAIPFTSIGYNMFAYPQYARVPGSPIKDNSRQSFIIIKNRDGKVGLRDRLSLVIPCEFEAIGHHVTSSVNYFRPDNPDIVFHVKKDGKWSDWHCVDHLDMNNSCTKDIVEQLEYNLEIAPLVDNAITYLNYLKATGTDRATIQELAEKYIVDLMLSRINTVLRDQDKMPIDNIYQIRNIANEFDYATLSGNYERLLPYANPYFGQAIIDDIQVKARDWKKIHSAIKQHDILGYKYLLATQVDLSRNEADTALAMDSTLLTSNAVRIMTAFLNNQRMEADTLLRNNANRILLSHTDGQPVEPDDPLWHFERYNTVANELRKYIRTFQPIGLITDAQAAALTKMIDRHDRWADYKPFDCIQKVEGNDSILRFINSSDPEPYSYFVDHGRLASPHITLFAMPADPSAYYETPVLVVDRFTGKRSYITSPRAETIGDFRRPTILPGEFDHAWPFSEGLAAVEVNGKIGFIDETGNMVINPEFYSGNKVTVKSVCHPSIDLYNGPDNIHIIFRDGLCPVADKNGLYGLIDRTGNWVTEPRYNHICPYDSPNHDSGYRMVRIQRNYGLLDPQGRELLPVTYPHNIYVDNDTVRVPEEYIEQAEQDLEMYRKQVEWEEMISGI